MSNKGISLKKNFLTCENYIPFNEKNILENFFNIAYILKIPLLVADNLSIQKRDKLLQNLEIKDFRVTTSDNFYEKLKSKNLIFHQLKIAYKDHLFSNDIFQSLLVSRKTINENSIEEIKQKLPNLRNQYEIISLYSDNQNILKWAAQDSRIDYITIEILENSSFIDRALCSITKQNNKPFEIVLSPLITVQYEKKLSEILRKGKKLLQLFISTNAPFIFTMKPKIPFNLRTGSQMRLLGELLGSSYNRTKISVFDKQLDILIGNTIRLDESYVVEGLKEV